jgi:hypothetical protein
LKTQPRKFSDHACRQLLLDEAHASAAENLMNQPATLTLSQWVLLRGIDHCCPVSLGSVGHLGDLRCLLKERLVTLGRTKVSVTPLGSEVLWYHRMH